MKKSNFLATHRNLINNSHFIGNAIAMLVSAKGCYDEAANYARLMEIASNEVTRQVQRKLRDEKMAGALEFEAEAQKLLGNQVDLSR